MAKIDTLFMSKTAENPYLLLAAHTYIAHVREYPPPPGIQSIASAKSDASEKG